MKEELEKIEDALLYVAGLTLTSDGYRRINEILNPPRKDEFLECDTCRAKAGSPTLCKGCLHNRTLIENLKKN